MKKLKSIKEFNNGLAKEVTIAIRGGRRAGSTNTESWATNWPEEGGSDTENWVYSDDNSQVISATVTNSQGGTRDLLD